MKTDENIKSIVVAAIRRHSMKMDEWIYTRLWDLGDSKVKAEISPACSTETSELPILYSYINATNWTFVTTRRVFYSFEGQTSFVFAKDTIEINVGNFKGYNRQKVERMRILARDGESHFCPFETGKASMGTIYAVKTLYQITDA